MANSWITFLKKWSKDNKVKYSDAIKDPKARAAYDKSKGTSKGKKGAVKTTGKDKDMELDDSTKKGGARKTARKAYSRGKADKK
tara:strand:- start:854 stop:1105 length:252 start_codon:yes stop_codon:yes gene_type:complete